jgi:hypothetical protein
MTEEAHHEMPTLSHEALTPRQREARGKHSARREAVRGPYTVWLHFSMLQICLNSAEVDLQSDRDPPFADVRGYQKLRR